MKTGIKLEIDSTSLDETVEKAYQLVSLLQEVQQIISSLSNAKELEKRIADLEVQVQSQQESKIDVDEVIDRLQVALSKQI